MINHITNYLRIDQHDSSQNTQPPMRFGSPVRNKIYTPKKAIQGMTRKVESGKNVKEERRKSIRMALQDIDNHTQRKRILKEDFQREMKVKKPSFLPFDQTHKHLGTGYTVSEYEESVRLKKDSNYEAFSQHFQSLKTFGDSKQYCSDEDEDSLLDTDIAEEYSYIEDKKQRKKNKSCVKHVNFSDFLEKIETEPTKISPEHQFEIIEQTCKKYQRVAKQLSNKKFLNRMRSDESQRSFKDETVEILKEAIQKKNSTPIKRKNNLQLSKSQSKIVKDSFRGSRNISCSQSMSLNQGLQQKSKSKKKCKKSNQKLGSGEKECKGKMQKLFESHISLAIQSEFQKSQVEELVRMSSGHKQSSQFR